MMTYFIKLIAVCVFAGVLIWILLPKPAFIIRITNGGIQVKKGRVPKGFLNECQLLAGENNLKNITIRGIRKRGSVHLKFSGQIPEATVQRFRNVWRQYI